MQREPVIDAKAWLSLRNPVWLVRLPELPVLAIWFAYIVDLIEDAVRGEGMASSELRTRYGELSKI